MKSVFKRLLPLTLAILIIASIGWYLFVYDRDFTRDMLLSQARFNDNHGNPRLASWFYNLAYNYSGQDENVAIELANQYKSDGNYTKAEYTLSNAIADGGTVELYIALCKTYVEQNKLLDAINMLDNISKPEIKSALESMRPAAPSPDPAPGFYSQYISVALTSEAGTLYYSVDGEYPSVKNEPYDQPIPLPAGETTIYAVSVADNGLVSPLSTMGFTIGGVIEMVEFSDSAIEASVRALLSVKESKTLYTNDLWEITEFVVPADAKSMDDLAFLPYLEKLTVEKKSFESLNCLTGLTKLTELNLINCSFPVDDLNILVDLPELERLTMSGCGLSTITKLTGAPKLTHLDLGNNALRNLEPLTSIGTLRELKLNNNAVTNLTAISALSNLTKLDVSYNSLASIAPLANCKKLNWLDVSNNKLTELEIVDGLTALSYLGAAHNELKDVDIVSACTNLTELNISNNTIKKIDALNTLTLLEELNFSYNQVSTLPKWPDGSALRIVDGSHNVLRTIDNLGNMENLTYLYLDYNQLTSINAIADCFNLVQVNIFGNKVRDVSALTEHNIIVNYDPS